MVRDPSFWETNLGSRQYAWWYGSYRQPEPLIMIWKAGTWRTSQGKNICIHICIYICIRESGCNCRGSSPQVLPGDFSLFLGQPPLWGSRHRNVKDNRAQTQEFKRQMKCIPLIQKKLGCCWHTAGDAVRTRILYFLNHSALCNSQGSRFSVPPGPTLKPA